MAAQRVAKFPAGGSIGTGQQAHRLEIRSRRPRLIAMRSRRAALRCPQYFAAAGPYIHLMQMIGWLMIALFIW